MLVALGLLSGCSSYYIAECDRLAIEAAQRNELSPCIKHMIRSKMPPQQAEKLIAESEACLDGSGPCKRGHRLEGVQGKYEIRARSGVLGKTETFTIYID